MRPGSDTSAEITAFCENAASGGVTRDAPSNGQAAGIDPSHGPIARMRDRRGFVAKAQFGRKKTIGHELPIARP